MHRHVLFGVLFAISGAAALVYEVAWMRLLTLQMGHTVAATSIVLAAFMGGLAMGAWVAGGPAASKVQARPLRAYAILELLIAAAALALPSLLAASAPVLGWAYADATAPVRFGLVRSAIAFALVGLPAAAMGATFPLAAAWVARGRERSEAAGLTGALYAANTAGTAGGAIAAGFWIIPAAGLRGATWTGVALNTLAACGALWLARGERAAPPAAAAATVENPPAGRKAAGPALKQRLQNRPGAPASRQVWPGLGVAAAAVSGCAALVYEVAWTRLLALIVGPTTYAFATMVAAFIGGLAIGSAAGTRMVRRSARPAVWLALMLVLSAVFANIAAWFAGARLPLIVSATVANPPPFGRLVAEHALLIGVLLLPMTFALGAAFPLALGVASGGGSRPGRDAARVYVANTLAAIGGSLACGFVLLPWLGLRSTFLATGIAGVLAGAACLAAAGGPKPSPSAADTRGLVSAAAVALAAIALIVLLPSWDRMLLSSGAYLYASGLQPADADAVLRAGSLEYYKEGAAATVSVRRVAGTRTLAVDGKVDASTANDMPTQRLLGLLPVLLHPAPEHIAIVGLGSGVTLAAALAPGTVRHADVVEISPEVVEAARLFGRENQGALDSDRVRLVVGDGRSHLALTTRRYDVIISEPSNPWMAGVAALFTREFFETVRARLNPGGLFCQWAHTYKLSDADLRSIARTFTAVFPEATMWLVGEADLLLIGTTGAAMTTHLETLAEQAKGEKARAALTEMAIPAEAAPFALLSLFAGGPPELARYAGDAALQTDDRTALEFSAPFELHGSTTAGNVAAIRAAAEGAPKPPIVQRIYDTATDAGWAARGRLALDSGVADAAYEAFERAVSRNADALEGFRRAASAARQQEQARSWLMARARAEPDNVPVRIELSQLLAGRREFTQAAAFLEEALRLSPENKRAADLLVAVLIAANERDQLTALADVLVERFARRPDARYYRAVALMMRGRTEEAIAEARAATEADPGHARAHQLLATACMTLGRTECARAAYTAALQADATDIVPYLRLGELELRSANASAAFSYFAEALFLNRNSDSARAGLEQARAARRATAR